MPNPVPAKYTVQLGPTVTPEVGGELAALGELSALSMSVVARMAIDEGLPKVRRVLQELHGPLPAEALAYHVQRARERGERQVRRRLDYDERTRRGATKMSQTLKTRKSAKTRKSVETVEDAAGAEQAG